MSYIELLLLLLNLNCTCAFDRTGPYNKLGLVPLASFKADPLGTFGIAPFTTLAYCALRCSRSPAVCTAFMLTSSSCQLGVQYTFDQTAGGPMTSGNVYALNLLLSGNFIEDKSEWVASAQQTYGGYWPENAIDGTGSFWHSNGPGFFHVDLGRTFIVDKVKVIARQGFTEGHKQMEIRVGSYPDPWVNPQVNPVCHEPDDLHAVERVYECAYPLEGRYIRLNKFSANSYHILELDVAGVEA